MSCRCTTGCGPIGRLRRSWLRPPRSSTMSRHRGARLWCARRQPSTPGVACCGDVTVAAGLDVGNSTTEVVLGRLTGDRIEVIAAGRAPTRRAKGSPASLDGAIALVRRLQRQHGVDVDIAAASPLRPVETATAEIAEQRPRTGRLWVAASGAGTAGGGGVGVGRPHRLGESALSGTDSLVAVVPPGM